MRADDPARATGARELDLSGRGLRAFPHAVFDAAETLEVLDLSRNALTGLPDDLGRLKRLRVLFCSGNPIARLPPSLGDCVGLSQVGFRGCGLREVPAESLPPALRWLTLTDNRIDALPRALGERPMLRKLMLAGNRLTRLPETLAGAADLELLRLSANGFDALPPWLTELPRLAWLAWAGNPLDRRAGAPPPTRVPWSDLRVGGLIGEGASGRVVRASWRAPGATEAEPVALKLFKGAITSDGLPACEMAACLAAGDHPNLVGGLGRLADHPGGADGLLMPLLPAGSRALAGPPSLASCSRDVYAADARFDPDTVLRIARGVGAASAHLHARGLLHGDLYAHNILWDGAEAMLSDFGAASFMPAGEATALARLDVRAWGLLLGELLDRCAAPEPAALRRLQEACARPSPSERPAMADALAALGRHG